MSVISNYIEGTHKRKIYQNYDMHNHVWSTTSKLQL
jgi:hypothetical protein